MEKEFYILKKSLEDFFTLKMLKYIAIPLIVTLVVMYLIFFTTASVAFTTMHETAVISSNGGEIVIDRDAPFIYTWFVYFVTFLFKYSFVSSFAGILFYIFGIFFILKVSLLLTIAVIGFLTPYIINLIHRKHYSDIIIKPSAGFFTPFYVLIKSLIIMIILFIVLIPLMLIPVVNIIAFMLPFYYFFHKLLNHDVASSILSKNEYRIIYWDKKNYFRIRTFCLYLLSLIPFLALFASVFYVIYLGHAYFSELKRVREDRNSNFLETKGEYK